MSIVSKLLSFVIRASIKGLAADVVKANRKSAKLLAKRSNIHKCCSEQVRKAHDHAKKLEKEMTVSLREVDEKRYVLRQQAEVMTAKVEKLKALGL